MVPRVAVDSGRRARTELLKIGNRFALTPEARAHYKKVAPKYLGLLDHFHSTRRQNKRRVTLDRRTEVRIDGTFDDHERIILKFHATDIARVYKDGRIEICTGFLCDSLTTRMRLQEHVGVLPHTMETPLIKKRKSFVEQQYGRSKRVMTLQRYTFKGVDNYITIKPDGKVDPRTVKGLELCYISKPKKARKIVKEMNEKLRYLLVLSKLGSFGGPTFNVYMRRENHTMPCAKEWLIRNPDVDVKKLSMDDIPHNLIPSWYGADPVFFSSSDSYTFDMLRRAGCFATKTVRLVKYT